MVRAPDTRLRARVHELFNLNSSRVLPRKVTEMRTKLGKSKPLAILVISLGIFACMPLLSNAHGPATAITIANNSSREIRRVYFSPTNQDNWGPDQLNNLTIPPGGSLTLGEVSCSGTDLKVIAEDQNGCFLYHVVLCNENATWTISNDAVPDCGN